MAVLQNINTLVIYGQTLVLTLIDSRISINWPQVPPGSLAHVFCLQLQQQHCSVVVTVPSSSDQCVHHFSLFNTVISSHVFAVTLKKDVRKNGFNEIREQETKEEQLLYGSDTSNSNVTIPCAFLLELLKFRKFRGKRFQRNGFCT